MGWYSTFHNIYYATLITGINGRHGSLIHVWLRPSMLTNR